MIKLSIIVTIYNIENYIEKCLESLTKNNIETIEIICVDDGSTDRSKNILKKYKARDKRIKILEKQNGGISSARNKGIEYAKGEYICFIDGDDYVDELMFENIINILNTNKVDTLFMGYYRVDWSNNIKSIYPKMNKTFLNENEIKNILIPSILGLSLDDVYNWFDTGVLNSNKEFPSVWRYVYSSKIIKKYNILFNENLITGEDIIFNWEYLHHTTNVQVINECFYYYMWRQNSLSQSYDKKYRFYESKTKLIEARNNLNKKLKLKDNKEYSSYYNGSIVLSSIQMALILSNSKIAEIKEFYKLFKKYVSMNINLAAYKNLKLNNTPIKYKIPLYLCKSRKYILLFTSCYFVNKMKVNIGNITD
jgi:glycosyltransferase involved in cell wall biosynthesis